MKLKLSAGRWWLEAEAPFPDERHGVAPLADAARQQIVSCGKRRPALPHASRDVSATTELLRCRRVRSSILVAHNQEFTRECWSERRHDYELFSSAVAVNEARRGEGPLANERLGFLAETTLLDITDAAASLARSRTRIPSKAAVDALHVAVATVHGMDYLLSWNCKQIVNGNILPQVYAVCRISGFEPP